jgi:hypothetical protein
MRSGEVIRPLLPLGPRRVLRWEAYAPVLQRGFDGIEVSDSEDPQRS